MENNFLSVLKSNPVAAMAHGGMRANSWRSKPEAGFIYDAPKQSEYAKYISVQYDFENISPCARVQTLKVNRNKQKQFIINNLKGIFTLPPNSTPGRFPSYLLFSSCTFPGTPYRIFLRFLPWLPCHFDVVVIYNSNVFAVACVAMATLSTHSPPCRRPFVAGSDTTGREGSYVESPAACRNILHRQIGNHRSY